MLDLKIRGSQDRISLMRMSLNINLEPDSLLRMNLNNEIINGSLYSRYYKLEFIIYSLYFAIYPHKTKNKLRKTNLGLDKYLIIL